MSDKIKKAINDMDLSEAGEAAMKAALAELDKGKDDLGDAYGKAVAAFTGDSKEALDELEKGKKAAEDAKEEADKKAKALTAASETALKALDQEKPIVGEAADALAKALDTERKVKHEDELPAHLKAQLDGAIKKAEEAEARIVKAEKKTARNETIAKCEKVYKHVPMKPGSMADMLIGLDADTRKSCEEMLGKADAILAKSSALDEFGHSGAAGGGSAMSKLKAIAKTYQDADANLTEKAAMVKAQRNNRDLCKQYDEER